MLFRKKEIKGSALAIGIMGAVGSIVLSGCGAANTLTETTAITGNAMFGPVDGATVNAYPISATTGDVDTSAQPLATTTTKADGTYSLAIPNTSIPSGAPIGVQMTNGSYTEEGSGATVSLAGQTFKSVLPSVTAGTPAVAAVNAFTDQAFQQFKTIVVAGLPTGTTPAVAAKNANYAMSQALGVPDIMVPPANTHGAIPNDVSGQMAILLASLSSIASSTSNSLGTTVTSADIAKAMAKALTASGGSFAKLGTTAVTITKPDGTTLTFTPPPLTGPGSLAATGSAVAAGTIPMANFIPPATLTMPTLNSVPPMTAPAAYIPGSTKNVPPPPISKPLPLFPNAPLPGSVDAIAAAKPPTVATNAVGSCAMTITPPTGGGAPFQGLCADVFLTGSADQLSFTCINLARQQFPQFVGGQAAPTAVGTYTPSTPCALPGGAAKAGTCTLGNDGMKVHFYSNASFPPAWDIMLTAAPAKCGTSPISNGPIGKWAPGV